MSLFLQQKRVSVPEATQGKLSAANAPHSRRGHGFPPRSLALLLGSAALLFFTAACRRGGPPPGMAGGPQAVPVRLSTVAATTLSDSSEFVGTLEAKRSLVLRPETDGRLSQIFVQAGTRVETGTRIAQLNPQRQPERRRAEVSSATANINATRAAYSNAAQELAALEAEKISLQAELDLQETELKRIASLVNEGALAKQALDRVRRDRDRAKADVQAATRRILAAQSRLDENAAQFQQAKADRDVISEEVQETLIRAPFAGIVGDVPVKVGDFVSQGDALTSLTQNQTLDLRLAVPIERESVLRSGLRVQLFDPKGNPLSSNGRISFVSPTVNTDSQTILAKASFSNADGRLRNGQFVRATLIWNQRPNALTVPANAIVFEGDNRFVYTAQPGEPLTVKQQAVQLGLIQRDRVEVKQGLKPGDRIVISGLQKLADGVPIAPLGEGEESNE